jgi:hypothetical protein
MFMVLVEYLASGHVKLLLEMRGEGAPQVHNLHHTQTFHRFLTKPFQNNLHVFIMFAEFYEWFRRLPPFQASTSLGPPYDHMLP